MDKWVDRVALVTGASSGIGAAIATALATHGMKVVGCGRNVKRIQDLASSLPADAKGSIRPHQCDVSKEAEILSMFEMVEAEFGGLDVCVNNAGLMKKAPILGGATEDWADMLSVNVLALTICSREAFKSMKAKKVDDGHIFNICSMSGHRMVRDSSTHFYAATKYAVKAITEGTRNELRNAKSHIRVTEISPGMVETEIFERMSGKEFSDKLFKKLKALESKDIADLVVYAMSAPPHVQIHDILLRPTEQVS